MGHYGEASSAGLFTKIDPEYELEVGTEISEERVAEAFEQDIKMVLSDCERLYPFTFENLPEEVQLIVANMMFILLPVVIEQRQ